MNLQKKVVLSLGSNIGNRLENIETCIQLVHQRIGLVLRVSTVYMKRLLGVLKVMPFTIVPCLFIRLFQQKRFYVKLRPLKKKWAVLVKKEAGYEARIIDVDIIALEEQVILESENVTIPHLQMQHRKFVLLPFQDLKLGMATSHFKQIDSRANSNL